MALGFTERLRIIFDVETQSFKQGVKSLKADLAAADGAAGKAKVGFAALGTQLSQYGAQAALAAGAALVAFGTKAVKVFQETALAAAEFSDRSGASVEDASRWIAVADDFGIAGTAVQTAFQRMNLAIEGNKFEEYGLDVQRAADGTVDANATFLQTATEIGKIPDIAERARVAQDVFGRSWGDISRLMQMDAEDLAAALEGVSDAQVIDEDEEAKAKRLQAAMDTLGDAFLDVQLIVGEQLAPAISGMTEGVSDLNEGVKDLTGSELLTWLSRAEDLFSRLNMLDVPGQWAQIKGAIAGSTTELKSMDDVTQEILDDFGMTADEFEAKFFAADDAAGELADTTGTLADETDALGVSMDNARSDAEQYATTMDGLNQRFVDAREAIDNLVGKELSKIEAFREAEDSTRAYAEALLDAEATTREQADAAIAAARDLATFTAGSYETEAGVRAQITALRDMAKSLAPGDPLRRQLRDYIGQLEGILTKAETELAVNVDETSVANAKATKDDLAAPVDVPFRPFWSGILGRPPASSPYVSAPRPTGDDTAGRSANVDVEGTAGAPGRTGVFVQNASDAWAAALRIWGALFGGGGESDADKMPSQRELFAKEFERARRRYEIGDVTAPQYLRVLQRLKQKYKFKRLSAPWMTLWREIKSVKEEIRKANEPEPEEPVDDSAAWDQAAENQAAIEAAQNLRDTAASSYADLTDKDPANDARALDAWASAIWRDIEARANAKYKRNKGRAWARFARRQLEKAQKLNPMLSSRLAVFLAGIPVFPSDDKGDDRADEMTEVGVVGPSAGTGMGGLPGGPPGLVGGPVRSAPAVHLHFPDALIVDGPAVDKAVLKLAPAIERAMNTRRRQS